MARRYRRRRYRRPDLDSPFWWLGAVFFGMLVLMFYMLRLS